MPRFDWTIDEQKMWPPRSRPRPPFGPTAIEVIRSCPLRGCFEASPGYERRMTSAGRVGTAFHRVLQSLVEDPPAIATPDAVAEEARQRFQAELAVQQREIAARPREEWLSQDDGRVRRAQEALLVEALRLHREGVLKSCGRSDWQGKPRSADGAKIGTAPEGCAVEVEVPVQSRDEQIHGRVDRAEHGPEGTRIVDYKSALREDLPGRYVRQVRLYAVLWQETRGDWPIEAVVVYPLTGMAYRVSVEPALCRQVDADARALLGRLASERDPARLAAPGDICKVCEFRPWCRPFWDWQAAEPVRSLALERASLGFEGEIIRLEAVSHHWQVEIRWRGGAVTFVAPEERFRQLAGARRGTRIRVLDARLHGLRHHPSAAITEWTELFLVAEAERERRGERTDGSI